MNPMRFQSSSGYSLAELMVAIAITGILVVLAIPAFDEMTFRARDAEAKANIAVLFELMTAFKAEHGAFTARLDAIGFEMDGATNYNYGFNADFPPPVDAPQGTAECFAVCGEYCASATWTCNESAYRGLDLDTGPFLVTATAFKASSHAHLRPFDPTDAVGRTFNIDQNKRIEAIIPAEAGY